MNDDRASDVRRYFTVTPARPVARRTDNERVLLLVGGVAGLVGVVLLLTSTLVGILLTVGGIALAVLGLQRIRETELDNSTREQAYLAAMEAAEPKPDDELMDRWLEESLRRAVDLGWRELGLKSLGGLGSAELQIIGVPRHTGGLTGRVGADGRLRLNSYEVTVLYLTDRRLCAFQSVLNMATGGLRQVSTHEFYRQHISTLATERSLTSFPILRPGAADSQTVQTRRFEIGASHATISTDIPVATPTAPDGLDWLTRPGLQAVEEVRRQLDWSAGRD